MDNRMDVQNLFEHIKFISEEAAHILREAVPYAPDILSLTMEDLNELLPGECNFQLRRQIMGLINVFLQVQVGQCTYSSPVDVMSPGPEVLQSKDLCTESDKKQQQMASLDTNKPNITNNSELPGKDTDPAGEGRELHQRVFVRAMEHSTGPSGDLMILCEDLAPEVLQNYVENTNVDVEEMLKAAWDYKRPNITNDSELPRKDTDPAEEESESHQKMVVSPIDYSTGSSGDIAISGKDTDPVEEKSESDQKTVVSPVDHSTGHSRDLMISSEGLAPEVQQSNVENTNVDVEEMPMAAWDCKRSYITKDSKLHRGGPKPVDEGSKSDKRMNVPTMEHSTSHFGETSWGLFLGAFYRSLFRYKTLRNYSFVKVHMLIAGEIFYTHETFMQKLNLRIEQDCSAKSSNVILVFCRVVSHIRRDMEAAMARVTENKPVILVFMHHCHHPSHMTNIAVQPSWSNIVQVVHCAFHESKGLLRCQENEQAVDAVRSALLRYK